jgi:hypothetical protein
MDCKEIENKRRRRRSYGWIEKLSLGSISRRRAPLFRFVSFRFVIKEKREIGSVSS